MEHLPVVLHGVKLGTQHWDKVRDPAKRRIEKARGMGPSEDKDLLTSQTMEEKGYVLRKRSEVRSDEEIVEVVRHRGEVLQRRPRNQRRPSSADDMQRNGGGGGRRGYRRDAGGYGSDSEGSVPPRSRNRARSSAGSKKGRDSSRSSSSDLGSTSGSEKECKKLRRKKWITAAFASVATVHAASKVYSSIEKHDKRILEVQAGTLSPEEAHKKARSARWQDAAAIGIAALGIKGAISEWHEVQEEHAEHQKKLEESREHHKRRLEHQKRAKAREHGGYYKGRDGSWYYDGPAQQHSERSKSRYNSQSQQSYDDSSRRSIAYEDRKMIEAPPNDRDRDYGRSRSRARSAYGNGGNGKSRYADSSNSPRSYSPVGPRRARSTNGRSRNGVVDKVPDRLPGASRLKKSRTIGTIDPKDPDVIAYREQMGDKSEMHDFGMTALEEVVDAVGDA